MLIGHVAAHLLSDSGRNGRNARPEVQVSALFGLLVIRHCHWFRSTARLPPTSARFFRADKRAIAATVGRASSARLAIRHRKVSQLNPETSRSRRWPRTAMLFVATASRSCSEFRSMPSAPRPRHPSRMRCRTPRRIRTVGRPSTRSNTTAATTPQLVARSVNRMAITTGRRRPSLHRELLLRRQRVLCGHIWLRGRRPGICHTERVSAGNSGTSLGNTTHGDTLYIPVPLFSNPPATQCTATATCVDHPPTIDLSRIAGALPGHPSGASVSNVPIPAHDHVVGTRNNGLPTWWNVEVVATTSPSTFATLKSVSAIQTALHNSTAIEAPTNAFLFFQVLPGTLSASMAANLTAAAPPGTAVAKAPPAPPASQRESGTTFNNLMNDCGATAPNCETSASAMTGSMARM